MILDLAPAIIGALIGALFGGALTAWFSRQASKTSATAELLKDWHSPSMRTVRRLAKLACERKPEAGLVGNWDEASEQEQLAITVVAGFFDRMSLLHKHRELNGAMLKSAFAGLIAFWVPLIVGQSNQSDAGEWRPLFNRLERLIAKTDSIGHPEAELYRTQQAGKASEESRSV